MSASGVHTIGVRRTTDAESPRGVVRKLGTFVSRYTLRTKRA